MNAPNSISREPVYLQTLFSTDEKKENPHFLSSVVTDIFNLLSKASPNNSDKQLAGIVKETKDDSKGSEMTIAWASDIHFDHANERDIDLFFNEVIAQKPSVLLLAGDIDMGMKNPVYGPTKKIIRANGLVDTIKKIKEKIACQIYFICGNHDFYFSSFNEVRMEAKQLTATTPGVMYIHETPGIELDPNTVLVGHDGWADSRSGDFLNSKMILMDFFHIKDFNLSMARYKEIFTPEMKKRLETMGDMSAEYAEQVLPGLLKKYRRVIFLTLFPHFANRVGMKANYQMTRAPPFLLIKLWERR